MFRCSTNRRLRAGLRVVTSPIAGVAGLIFLTGCTVAGTWAGGDVQPEMARDQIAFLRPDGYPGRFVDTTLRLQKDGSYTAQMNYDGNLQDSLGRWEASGKKLTLTDNEGRSFIYLMTQPQADTLKLTKGVKGSDVTLTLKKQS